MNNFLKIKKKLHDFSKKNNNNLINQANKRYLLNFFFKIKKSLNCIKFQNASFLMFSTPENINHGIGIAVSHEFLFFIVLVFFFICINLCKFYKKN